MNQFAMYLGYAVMVWMGVLAIAGLALFALEQAWMALKRRETWKVVGQAMREWAENHPEEAAKARERGK